jgi:2-polyprenyl-6-methoxyphenol hydroxylase-like FAD-dependent oxidoreductase
LLVIGDAAHAMSPIGGVGINLAVQYAVAAANLLAAVLAGGENCDPLLHKVQARRMRPVQLTQGMQKLVQDAVIAPARCRAPAAWHSGTAGRVGCSAGTCGFAGRVPRLE